jgi:hypothetical protein
MDNKARTNPRGEGNDFNEDLPSGGKGTTQ